MTSTPRSPRGARAMLLPLFLLVAPATVSAQDAYYDLLLDDVAFDEPLAPEQRMLANPLVNRWSEAFPRVWIEGGEGYLVPEASDDGLPGPLHLVVLAPAGADVRGQLVVPGFDGTEPHEHDFLLKPEHASDAARGAFLRGRYVHYEDLRLRDLPGAAWFRHRADETRRELEALGVAVPHLDPIGTRFWSTRQDDLEDTYSLFTGGRALSENLQLDRALASGEELEPTIPIAEITGITTQELDWKSLLAGRTPALDPLASLVPADQHALFFASYGALVDLVDELGDSGAPVLQLLEPRSEDARVIERYEEQLCLSVRALPPALASTVISRVVVTGSDPYFRTGTDLALLLESAQPELLEAYVRAQQDAAVKRLGASRVNGMIGGLAYVGVESGDWRVASYLARAGSAVVVTNALSALEAIGAVQSGERAALASLDEFAFFRDRYPLGDASESAFLVLSDATIRRWCGPRWRIGASRRLRAAAVLADEQATHLAELASGQVEERVLREELELPGGGAVSLDARGAVSATYGSLDFLTPIALLDLEQVTPAERDGYVRFRDMYQANWRRYFDPIGARLSLAGDTAELDLSVLPLIAGSDYGELTGLAGAEQLEPRAGDPHADALLHFIYAIDRHSPTFRQLEGGLSFLPTAAGSALAWVGESFEVFVDRDPVWAELAAAEDPDEFLDEHVYELPIALRVASRDPLRLAAFLTALRSLADGSAPGLVRWENREHQGQPYVAILVNEEQGGMLDLGGLGIFYTPGADALVVSLRETVIQHAIERRQQRAAARGADGDAAQQEVRPWLGASAAFRIEREGIELATKLMGDRYLREMQARAWAALPILSEWRRLFPDVDPLELHERFWHVRLTEPGGGRYVWDEALGTMSSTLYGSPGAALHGPPLPEIVKTILSADLGLTFEQDGLRARAKLRRSDG